MPQHDKPLNRQNQDGASQSRKHTEHTREGGGFHPAAIIQKAGQSPRAVTPHEITQLQKTIGNRAVRQLMRNQVQPKRENRTGLPDQVKTGAEKLSGLSLDDVKVHYNSPRPETMGAAAYTQGKEIHVVPGQEQHVPHEAWHVVQQAQGRVRPTLQLKDAAVNDDPELEREADEMGRKILQAKPDETTRLASANGTFSGVRQFARLENADPLLANGRNLLEDVDTLLKGLDRPGLGEPKKKSGEEEKSKDKEESKSSEDIVDKKKSQNLLDTTYDNPGENLVLDLDMLYEENLQRKIEHNRFFTDKLKMIVGIIHKWLGIQSVENKDTKSMKSKDAGKVDEFKEAVEDPDKTYKADRIQYILKYVGKHQKKGEMKKDEELEKLKHELKETKWNPDTKEIGDKETKRMVTGYAKLLKMLETQYPYFGGSEEYEKNEKEKLEYWVYHMSTLTKDPQRQYSADHPRSKLVKPMKDYRTRKGGMVPHQNQRNLGTGIVELKWEELPPSLKPLIYKELSNLDLFGEIQTDDRDYKDQSQEKKGQRKKNSSNCLRTITSKKMTFPPRC